MKKMSFVALLTLLFIFLNCSKEQPGKQQTKSTVPPKKTYVVVTFDVEDYVTPAKEGIDNIPKWLADIMTEEGVTGTFFVIGEKARSLEKRGRQDVIQAMARHDIGSHTNLGSIHPTVTERLEKAGWDDGVERMLRDESKGFAELERIFGAPVSNLARHGGSYGPQLVYALGKMGKGYVYSPINLPGHNAVWFCNTLNFHGEYGGFDDSYYKDELFNPLLDSLKGWFPKLVKNSDVISFFGCHPCKVRTVQFWDFNYYKGANPDSGDWKTPELRPLESMKTAQKNFRRLMKYLKSRDDIEITTYRKVKELFSHQKEFVTAEELIAVTNQVVQTHKIFGNDYFSPAEIFAALAKSIVRFRHTHFLPDSLPRTSPLGPMAMPDSLPGVNSLPVETVLDLAEKATAFIESKGHLPAGLKYGDATIGSGSLYGLFSALLVDITSGVVADTYPVPAFEPYPKTNIEAILQQVNGCKTWPVHRPDLNISKIVELTKMQLWTLKPAMVMSD